MRGMRFAGVEPNVEPNAVLVGEKRVYCDTNGSTTGCQAVEAHAELGAPGPAEWRPCGLPVFATVYGGAYDKQKQEDVTPVLCWRHLRALGDTRDLIVRPS